MTMPSHNKKQKFAEKQGKNFHELPGGGAFAKL